MKKGIVVCLFFLALSTILFSMVVSTIKYDEETLARIDPANKELEFKGLRPRLTPEEVTQITNRIRADLVLLNSMKKVLLSTTVSLIILLLWIVMKSETRTSPFDGLTLLVVAILSFGLHVLFNILADRFDYANNATMDIRMGVSVGLLIIHPLLFFFAYKWNKAELQNVLHTHKWISTASIVFTIISASIALVVGIGVLLTPDLSGNIS